MTPEKLREIAAEIMRHKSTVAVEGVVPQWLHDQLLAHAAALEELAKERSLCEYFANGSVTWQHRYEAALEEIERLKGLLAAAAKELPHCSGPVHERIAVYRREHAKQIEQAERRAERLKFHAEAMAIAWEKLDFDDGESEDAMEEAVFSYRADFQKE